MELVIKYKPTIEKQLLTPLAYKIVQWIALCEFLIVLILPWFKLMDLSAGTLGCHSLTLTDLFAEFLERQMLTAL